MTYLRAKRNGHSLHSYGLSPVCARRCRPTCWGLVNVAEHSWLVSLHSFTLNRADEAHWTLVISAHDVYLALPFCSIASDTLCSAEFSLFAPRIASYAA